MARKRTAIRPSLRANNDLLNKCVSAKSDKSRAFLFCRFVENSWVSTIDPQSRKVHPALQAYPRDRWRGSKEGFLEKMFLGPNSHVR